MLFSLTACGGGNSPTASQPIVVAPPAPPPPPVSQTPVTFSDATAASGVGFASGYDAGFMHDLRFFAGGMASGDVDNDGDIDVFVTPGDIFANRLLINDGTGQFTDQAAAAGLEFLKGGTENHKFSGPLLADFDGDGFLDLFIGGIGGDPCFLFRNNGDGTFSDVSVASGISAIDSFSTISSAAGDYDKDGDLDLLLAHWGTPRTALNPGDTQTLWRNDSQGTDIVFTSVSVAIGLNDLLELSLLGVLGGDHDYTFAPNFADFDDDGHMDILMVSDFTGSQVLRNKGDNTFEDVTDRTQIVDSNGMGSATGDFDNDLDTDWFVSSVPPNRLYENVNGVMINNTDSAIGIGGWGWGSCFADFNMDGDLDIFQTNGWISDTGANPQDPFTTDRSRLWRNNGDKTFDDIAGDAGVDDNLQGRGVVCADFNGDRQVDILLFLYESQDAAILWLNDNMNANTLEVRLKGIGKNDFGLGAKVIITDAGASQMRTVNLNSNFISHNPAIAYFGFQNGGTLDEVKTIWPDGKETILSNVSVNQVLEISHPDRP